MECRDTKLLMEAYWDRHLPPDTAARVERHLNDCPACRAEFGAVTQLLTNPEPVAVTAGLGERIRGAIETLPLPAGATPSPSARMRRWHSILRAPWAGALAACVTFAFLGWLSSQIPGGGGVPNDGLNAKPAKSPNLLLAFGWAQSMAVPGPCSSLAAMAQTSALDTVIEPHGAVADARGRLRLSDLPATNSTPAMQDLPIVAGAMYAGYPH